MDPTPREPPTRPEAATASQQLLARLEAISRERPDRVLRLSGTLRARPASDGDTHDESSAFPPAADEPFELVIYRGFSSSTTHPTAFDPDQPALGEAASIEAAALLRAPLDPAAEEILNGPGPVHHFLQPENWG